MSAVSGVSTAGWTKASSEVTRADGWLERQNVQAFGAEAGGAISSRSMPVKPFGARSRL
jgi:hypothetical protein